MAGNDGKKIELSCCYCGKLIELDFPDNLCFFGGRKGRYSWLRKAHCIECEEEHKDAMKTAEGKMAYKRFLNNARYKTRVQVAKAKGIPKPEKKVLYIKKGHLFREQIDLGKIIKRKNDSLWVRKGNLASAVCYSRQCIQ
jgi:hypothetical protein